jgi:hypothetical protein
MLKRKRKFIDENKISLDSKDLILHCVVASNSLYDQPDDGLEKGRNMWLFLRYAM